MEVIPIAILFSQVKVQSADQSETFLISGIPKEYEDLTESVQLEWFLQDIDSDETVQVHADAYLYGEGEPVNATHAELCYFLDRIRVNPNFLESRCQSAGSSDFSFEWSPDEWPGGKFCVSVFRQNQEYHIINVHDWGLFPLATAFPGGWDGMRALRGVNAVPASREA